MKLTGRQQVSIGKARELVSLGNAEKVREYTGDTDLGMAYVVAFRRAQWELDELLTIIDELTGAEK